MQSCRADDVLAFSEPAPHIFVCSAIVQRWRYSQIAAMQNFCRAFPVHQLIGERACAA